MGKKSAHTGMSPKDRGVMFMHNFIVKNERRTKKSIENGNFSRNLSELPIDEWPTDKQIEYYKQLTPNEQFDLKYTTYSDWIKIVQKKSGVYHRTFYEFISNKIEMVKSLYNDKIWPQEAVRILNKHGVY